MKLNNMQTRIKRNMQSILSFNRYLKNYYIFLFFLILAIIPIFTQNPYILHILIMSLFWATAGSAWNLLGGYCGQVSLGHGAFFGLGSYIMLLLLIIWGIAPIFGIILGSIISAVVGFLIAYPFSRLKGAYYSLATLAFGESILILFLLFREITGGAVGLGVPFIGEVPFLGAKSMGYRLQGNPLFFFQFKSKIPFFYIIFGLILCLIYITHVLEKSKFGIWLQAISEDEDAAMCCGVPCVKYKMYATAISAFLTSICGSYYALYVRYVIPGTVFNVMMAIKMAIVVILGGLGTIWGPLIGSFILIPVSEILRVLFAGSLVGGHMVVYGAIMIIIILLIPEGILPFWRTKKRK